MTDQATDPNQADEIAPFVSEPDPEHQLAEFVTVNGARMRCTFASYRERHECLALLVRPWNADGRLHPAITLANTYNPRRYTLDVLGFPVVVEFATLEDAVAALPAYLADDQLPPEVTGAAAA